MSTSWAARTVLCGARIADPRGQIISGPDLGQSRERRERNRMSVHVACVVNHRCRNLPPPERLSIRVTRDWRGRYPTERPLECDRQPQQLAVGGVRTVELKSDGEARGGQPNR